MKTGLVIAGLLLVGCGSSTSADAPLAIDGPVTPMPDAKPGTPDAKPGTPDAPVTVADARPGTPDAPPSQMCFPQCYIDALTTLVAGCAPTGSCTTHTDIGTFTTTTCYANGVK